jgi:hypothetical protein
VIPTRLFEERTVLLGSCVCFWHFICQFTYESYFTSFLQVHTLPHPTLTSSSYSFFFIC